MTNKYVFQFNIGEIYMVNGDIKFGVNGNGFHMCKNMVDVFRYYNTFEEDFVLCEVFDRGR